MTSTLEPAGIEVEPGRPAPPDQGKRSVALLLAAAAVVAAALGAMAATHASEASAAWSQAVRQEMKRAIAAVEDIRFVYTDEARAAFRVTQAELRLEAFEEAAAEATDPVVAEALVREASILEQLLTVITTTGGMTDDPRYALPEGGYDVALRLGDRRSENADLVAIDPEVPQRLGDLAAGRARLTVLAALPVGLTFLLGIFAGSAPRWRRALMVAGAILLATAVALGAAVSLGLISAI